MLGVSVTKDEIEAGFKLVNKGADFGADEKMDLLTDDELVRETFLLLLLFRVCLELSTQPWVTSLLLFFSGLPSVGYVISGLP